MSSTHSTKKQETYEQIKDRTIKKIITHAKDLRADIIDMIRVLRNVEKKERGAITQQLKNDFVLPKYLGKTTLLEIIKEEYEPNHKLEKEQKKKIAIAAGTGDQILEGGSGSGDDQEEDDIITKREKAREERDTKLIKKGSAQMPKLKPTVNASELENDNEDEDEEEEIIEEDEDIPMNVLKDVNNIVIDDLQHLEEIKKVIVKGHAVVIEVDSNLMLLGIREGAKLKL